MNEMEHWSRHECLDPPCAIHGKVLTYLHLENWNVRCSLLWAVQCDSLHCCSNLFGPAMSSPSSTAGRADLVSG